MTQAAVNFLPEDYVEKRIQSRSNLICIGLFVVVISAVMGAYYFTRPDEVFAQRDRVSQELQDATQKLAQLDQLKQQQKSLMDKLMIASVLKERVPRSKLLAHVLLLMKPEHAWITTFDLKSRDLPLPPPPKIDPTQPQAPKQDDVPKVTPVEVTIALTGMAHSDEDVANFISKLNKSTILTNVNLAFSEEYLLKSGKDDKDEQKVRRFKVDMKLPRDADATNLKLTDD